MTTLMSLETDCRRFADAREALAQEVYKLNEQIETLKRAHLPAIKRLVAKAAEKHGELRNHLEDAPDLFVRPRTVIFHGIKIGYQKNKGSIEIPNADDTIARVKKMFADPAPYLRVKESLNKDALCDLPLSDAKKLGLILHESTDDIVIKPTDGAVDKIVNALLSEATGETAAASAA